MIVPTYLGNDERDGDSAHDGNPITLLLLSDKSVV